jgi:magnesium-transporting ATPase (P-type)
MPYSKTARFIKKMILIIPLIPGHPEPNQCQFLNIQGINSDSMTENAPKPAVLRIVAAVILGIFVGLFLFFGLALVIGAFNNTMGTNIPISTQVTENVISAILLIVIIIACVAFFCWKVYTSPPTTPEFEIPETIDKF